MREITFRAWDKTKRQFLPDHVYAVINPNGGAFGIMVTDWEEYKQGEFFFEEYQELSQFTGLKDKNGKEIYEGDVIEFEELIMESGVIKCPVVFWMGMFTAEWDRGSSTRYFLLQEIDDHDQDIEIVGNIYENPDLLNNQ